MGCDGVGRNQPSDRVEEFRIADGAFAQIIDRGIPWPKLGRNPREVSAMRDTRIKETLGLWADIANELRLDASDFRHKVLWQKNEPNRSHVVLELIGANLKLVLKKIFLPTDMRLTESMEMQQKAAQAMPRNQGLFAPEVLYVSQDGSLAVMEFLQGKTLNDHLEAGKPEDRILRRSGKWLAAFHSSFQTTTRTYQPHFMVNHIQRVAQKVALDQVKVPERDLFLRCCDRIPAMADKCGDRQTISAKKHGDLNVRNLMIGPPGVVGLDFAPESAAPVGFDITRLLMDYAELFQDPSDVLRGQLLSSQTTKAFFDGYSLVGVDDPAVEFLPFVQILNDWRIIPSKSSDRSLRQSHRLGNLLYLAQKGFGT